MPTMLVAFWALCMYWSAQKNSECHCLSKIKIIGLAWNCWKMEVVISDIPRG